MQISFSFDSINQIIPIHFFCTLCYNKTVGTRAVSYCRKEKEMFGLIRKTKREVRDRAVYMEVFGDNKVAYRVLTGRIEMFGEEISTYGIEAEDYNSGDKETISDFSRNIEDAVDFAELLISKKIPPRQMYNQALGYLCVSI